MPYACRYMYDDDEHLEFTDKNKENLKLTSGTSAEYCKEELNSGSRSLTSVSRISSKTLLLWRPSETSTCKSCRDTVNAETKSGWQKRTTKNLRYIVVTLTDGAEWQTKAQILPI